MPSAQLLVTPTRKLPPGLLTLLWWLILAVACWYSLFWRLGALPLQTWDESRLAVSAAEMLRSGNWLVTTYGGQPDLWNVKPPLLIWLEAASLRTFGHAEWAFRLPAAVASLLLVLLMVRFAHRWLGGRWPALLAALALLSCKAYVTNHVARTGDYEALLLLLLTAQVTAVFVWTETRRGSYLLLAGAATALAVLTKGVAGLFFAPGLVLYLLWRRQLPQLLRQPGAWLALLLALVLPAAWYVVREQAGPGYWQAVNDNELLGRLGTSLEQEPTPWYTYLAFFFSHNYLLWLPWLVGASVLLARLPRTDARYRFLFLTGLTVGTFLLLISVSATKHVWYSAPVFPLLALVLGAGLALLAQYVATRPMRRATWAAALLIAAAYVPSFVALHSRLHKAYKHRFDEPELQYGFYLRRPDRPQPAHLTLLQFSRSAATQHYNAPMEFYALAWQHDHPSDTVATSYDPNNLRPARLVAVCGSAARQLLLEHFTAELVHQHDSCSTYRLRQRRF